MNNPEQLDNVTGDLNEARKRANVIKSQLMFRTTIIAIISYPGLRTSLPHPQLES